MNTVLKKSEAALLAGKILAYERRDLPDEKLVAMTEAWHEALADLRYEDCRDAIAAYYRESTDWIMPAHIRERVARIQAERYARARIPDPPAYLDDATQRRAILAARAAAADGRDAEQAMAEVVQAFVRRELNGGTR